jgi:hypothetical protein
MLEHDIFAPVAKKNIFKPVLKNLENRPAKIKWQWRAVYLC